ncbi:MAG: hypothetical protein BWZ08_02165 [candidate division BRC1 bacterium ADurb.BinA292]|nr:MAG: hypothetical protein BWZ08_02165 [candidate division BRC1 bacterium ADurb.BinA292]
MGDELRRQPGCTRSGCAWLRRCRRRCCRGVERGTVEVGHRAEAAGRTAEYAGIRRARSADRRAGRTAADRRTGRCRHHGAHYVVYRRHRRPDGRWRAWQRFPESHNRSQGRNPWRHRTGRCEGSGAGDPAIWRRTGNPERRDTRLPRPQPVDHARRPGGRAVWRRDRWRHGRRDRRRFASCERAVAEGCRGQCCRYSLWHHSGSADACRWDRATPSGRQQRRSRPRARRRVCP